MGAGILVVGAVGAAVAVAAGVISSFGFALSCPSTLGAGVEAVAGVAPAASDPVALLLLGFSFLNTLLILFTYLPKLRRRSASLVSDGPAPDGVDMVFAICDLGFLRWRLERQRKWCAVGGER